MSRSCWIARSFAATATVIELARRFWRTYDDERQGRPSTGRPCALIRDIVHFRTWEGEGSRTSPRHGDVHAGGTTTARLFQTACMYIAMSRISESETAFPVMHERPNARTTQHRPDAKASMAGP